MDEVKSQSESSLSNHQSHQEPIIEENFMEIDSSINDPLSPINKKETQAELIVLGKMSYQTWMHFFIP